MLEVVSESNDSAAAVGRRQHHQRNLQLMLARMSVLTTAFAVLLLQAGASQCATAVNTRACQEMDEDRTPVCEVACSVLIFDITMPSGRISGYDPSTLSQFDGSPGQFWQDGPYGDGDLPTFHFKLNNPEIGQYRINIYSDDNAMYHLTIHLRGRASSNIDTTLDFPGLMDSGSTQTIRFFYLPSDRIPLHVEKDVNSTLLMRDFEGCRFELGSEIIDSWENCLASADSLRTNHASSEANVRLSQLVALLSAYKSPNDNAVEHVKAMKRDAVFLLDSWQRN